MHPRSNLFLFKKKTNPQNKINSAHISKEAVCKLSDGLFAS